MIIKLPTIIEKKWDEESNKLIITKGELPVELDTSFKAHLKWEEQFAANLGGIDLQTYTARVQRMIDQGSSTTAEVLSMLKLLYCYINSDKLPTFRDFLGLFDLEVADEIINKIRVVLEEVGKSATKN